MCSGGTVEGYVFCLCLRDDLRAVRDGDVYNGILAAGSAGGGDPVADPGRVFSVQCRDVLLSAAGGRQKGDVVHIHLSLCSDECDRSGLWDLV